MEIREIFTVLGISKTKDERLIRDAYRKLLVQVNPEDDPEGFKRLRKAYEEALAYADTKEQENGVRSTRWIQDDAVGAFLRNVADVYEALPRRLDEAEWKALVSEPVLESLDDGETAKWGLFSYLSEHFRLPGRIWRILDGAFFIEENRQEFTEHTPNGFVEYVLNKIHQDDLQDLPYEAFRGAPDADYDGFIGELFDLMGQQDRTSREGLALAGQRLEKLSSFGIRHPWYEAERARQAFYTGQKEEALQTAGRLLREYPEDERCCLTTAELLMGCGCVEEACRAYEELLNRAHTEYGAYRALCHLASAELKRENWKRARELADEAGRFRGTDEIQEILQEASEHLIHQFLSGAASLTEEEARMLGWCFVDTKRQREGAAFFEEHSEYPEDSRRWDKLMAALYQGASQPQKVIPYIGRWRGHIEEELKRVRAGEELALNEAQLLQEQALCFHVEGAALTALYLEKAKEDESQALRLYERALEAHGHAIEREPDHTEYRMHRIILLRERKEYQKVVDECEEILKRNPNHFWACFYMQEAYEGLRMAQAVIDTFYRAKKIYAGHPQIYARAMKVFGAYRQFKDALDILDQAKKAGVDGDPELLLGKMKVLNQLSEDQESWLKAKAYADEAIGKMEEAKASNKLLSEAYLRRAQLLDNAREDQENCRRKSQEDAKRALELDDNIDARYFLGRNYIKYFKDPKKAYEHLKVCESRGDKFVWIYFYIAQCHEEFREWNEAIVYYKKVMEIDPEFRDALWRIGWLYRRKYARTEQLEYASQALSYIDRQQEKFGDGNQPYRWRANILMRMGEYEKALEEIEKGIEKDPDSGMWFLKGQNLRYVRRYEEAIVCYENSLRAEDRYGEDNKNSYRNIFQCFLRQRRYQEGVSYFKEALGQKLTEELRKQCLQNLADLEAQAGHRERALFWLGKEFGGTKLDKRCCASWEEEANRMEEILDIWQGYEVHADQGLEALLRDASALADMAYEDEGGDPAGRALMCHNMGERYYYEGDHKTSFVYFQRALELAQQAGNYKHFEGLWLCLSRACWWLKDAVGSALYADKYRKELERTYEECRDLEQPMEALMTSPGVSRDKLYHLFCWAYYADRTDKLYEYMEKMRSRRMCYWCGEDCCTELWEMEGFLAYREGRQEEALAYFEKAAKTCWLGVNTDARVMINMLQS